MAANADSELVHLMRATNCPLMLRLLDSLSHKERLTEPDVVRLLQNLNGER